MPSSLLPLKYYVHTLICTLSATSVRKVPGSVISCNRIGCECHVLDDPHYTIILPLLTIFILTAVALTFGPRTESIDASNAEPVPANTQQMCIECGHSVSSLYTEYGRGHIRLTQCTHCQHFADKYVELDVVSKFIDLLLHKPQVYRHLLVNKLEYRQPTMERNVSKLGILLILFNVYIDWFRLEEGGRKRNVQELLFGHQHSFAVQYLVILGGSIIDAMAVLGGVLAASVVLQRGTRHVKKWPAVATALVISSFGKVLTLLLVIWDYNEAYYPWLLDVLQFTSQTTAISVLFDTQLVWAGLVVVFAASVKQLVHFMVLTIASLLF